MTGDGVCGATFKFYGHGQISTYQRPPDLFYNCFVVNPKWKWSVMRMVPTLFYLSCVLCFILFNSKLWFLPFILPGRQGPPDLHMRWQWRWTAAAVLAPEKSSAMVCYLLVCLLHSILLTGLLSFLSWLSFDQGLWLIVSEKNSGDGGIVK